MFVDVSCALMNPGQQFPFSQAVEIPDMEVLNDPVSFDGAVVEGFVVGSDASVEVVGAVSAKVTSRCAKCLEPVTIFVRREVDELFTRPGGEGADEAYPLEGSKIDPTDMATEALLLELPIRFLCSDDCQGLCPQCGKNRNQTPCTCQEGGERQNPFSALSELLTKDEEV